MQEIKFRAWDEEQKKMKDWEYYGDIPNTAKAFFELEFILMQYTGLKDRNGKEIYHKDYLKYHRETPQNTMNEWEGGLWIIEFGFWELELDEYSEYIYGWYLDGYDEYKRRSGKLDRYKHLKPLNEVDNTEVIGNIYENPKLLESK